MKRNGAEIVIESLKKENVDVISVIPAALSFLCMMRYISPVRPAIFLPDTNRELSTQRMVMPGQQGNLAYVLLLPAPVFAIW